MFRFTIRDLLWLTVVVAAGLAWLATAHRSALLEARMQSAERRVEQLKAENEAIAGDCNTYFATYEAWSTAFKRADLSEQQKDGIRKLYGDEMKRLGVRIVEEF